MSEMPGKEIYLVLFYIEEQLCSYPAVFSDVEDAARAKDLWTNLDGLRPDLLREHPNATDDDLRDYAYSHPDYQPFRETVIWGLPVDNPENAQINRILLQSMSFRQTIEGALLTRSAKKQALLDIIASTKSRLYSNLIATALRLSLREVYELVEDCEAEGLVETNDMIELPSGVRIIEVGPVREPPIDL